MIRKHIITSLILIGLVILISTIPLFLIQDSEFGGTDGVADELIQTIDASYTPWAESLWEPPGGETESLLFCLQAVIGSAVLFGGIGYMVGSRSWEKKQGNAGD
ncbi:MAG: energy-coupling factor ABC transporter substrate-binding protein [Clostridiales Family XIII bacterium]|jgi:cobalt/nickel transport protein|nr:energy-coupling factor ABC transporter substrate-binding protein [Clostridiales Family XIII bacterium]